LCYPLSTKTKGDDVLKEITVRENELGLAVFIDGEPNLADLTSDELTVLATVFEVVISKQYENYNKRKGEYQKIRKSKKMPAKTDT